MLYRAVVRQGADMTDLQEGGMESLVKEGTIGSVLYRSRIITEEDIRLALEEQRVSGCRFGEALVKLGIVRQEDIDWALSNQLDIPYVRLSEEIIDPGAIRLVPAELARKYNLIPIIRTGDELHIALADPLNKAAVEEVARVTGCLVTVSMPIIRELREMLDFFYGPARDDACFGFSSTSFSPAILDKINQDRSGARLLEYLVLFFLQNGISSISLQPAGGMVRISGRRGRVFREIGRFPVGSYPDLLTCIRKLTQINGSRELANEGTVVFRYRGHDVVLRVSLLKALEGECVTFRLWPDHGFPAGLDEMGLSPDTAAGFRSLAAAGSGLVLFASWNRMERCRFLDLVLDEGVTAGRNVLLLGDGIGRGKKTFPRIPLQDSPPEELETVVTALADHDPDILLMEDISGNRSFLAAWRAAMRRSLVVAGISCGGLPGAFDYLLAERHVNRSVMGGVRALASFVGVRTLCPQCRESFTVSDRERDLPPADVYYRARGCAACGYSRFGGKRYLMDIVAVDPALRDVFASARDGSEILRHLDGTGYRGIAGELGDLLRSGDISPEEYLACIA